MEILINDNTIIKDDIYNTFKDSVSCPLCFSILINPIMCMNCQNVFCKSCINEWSKKDDKCPNRCANPNYKRSLGKNEILSKIKVKCENCGNPIQYDNVLRHYKSCCPEKIPPEVEKNIEEPEIKPTKKPKLEKISREEIENLKRNGNDVTDITGKKNNLLILYYNT